MMSPIQAYTTHTRQTYMLENDVANAGLFLPVVEEEREVLLHATVNVVDGRDVAENYLGVLGRQQGPSTLVRLLYLFFERLNK
jgi:hypothetical protein